MFVLVAALGLAGAERSTPAHACGEPRPWPHPSRIDGWTASLGVDALSSTVSSLTLRRQTLTSGVGWGASCREGIWEPRRLALVLQTRTTHERMTSSAFGLDVARSVTDWQGVDTGVAWWPIAAGASDSLQLLPFIHVDVRGIAGRDQGTAGDGVEAISFALGGEWELAQLLDGTLSLRYTSRPDTGDLAATAALAVAGRLRACASPSWLPCLDTSVDVAAPRGEWITTSFVGVGASARGLGGLARGMVGAQWSSSSRMDVDGLPTGLVVRLLVSTDED